MKSKFYLALFVIALVFSAIISGCDAEKEAAQRKSLMMPRKSDMMRNERYNEVDKRKTNKVKLNKAKRKKLF